MIRRAFTMIELLMAIMILGVLTAFAVMTFNAVSSSWTVSAEYMDKIQRSDYALNQVVSGLRSMYYPHDGTSEHYEYGFMLYDNGDGRDPDRSDVIEWAKTGPAIVGSQNASADTVHRVQVMVLEEGNRDYKDEIQVTGLYARLCPDTALRPKSDRRAEETDYSFANNDMYQPVLVVDGVVGFNCRVMESPAKMEKGEADKEAFDDVWEKSNSVPYKVELTFHIADPDGRSYRSNTAPMVRIVNIPIYEQAQDGAALPSADGAKGAGVVRGGGTGGASGGSRGGGGGGGARGGGGAPGGGAPGGAPPPGGGGGGPP